MNTFPFPAASKDAWQKRFTKELKDLDPTILSQRSSAEEINVPPYWSEGEVSVHDLSGILPNKSKNEWLQTFLVTPETTNEEVLYALNCGSNSLVVAVNVDLQKVLQGVNLGIISTHIEVLNLEEFSQKLKLYEKEITAKNLTFGLSNSHAFGSNIASSLGCCSIDVHVDELHFAGANVIFETAVALAKALEVYFSLPVEIAKEFLLPRFRFNVGTDYFLEIARLRAFRVLWANIAKEIGINGIAFIDARTSIRELATTDEDSNLLRLTTMAMAAACGTADSISVASHKRKVDHSSIRLAQSIHNILIAEGIFHQSIDPSFGAYYIEAFTEEVMNKVWEKFLWIQSLGGYSNAELAIKEEVARIDAIRKADFASGKVVKVGVNKYKG